MKQLFKRAYGTAMWVAHPQDRYLKTELLRPLPLPIGPLDFEVVARETSAGYTEMTEPIILKMKRKPDGYFLHFGLTRTQGGSFRRNLLERGNYAIRVTSPLHFYQDANIDEVSLDQDLAKPEVRVFDLMPGFAYPFSGAGRGLTLLRGSLHITEGVPLAGAVVTADEALYSYTTNATGQWALVFSDQRLFSVGQPSANVTVTVYLPGKDRPEVVAVAGVPVEQGSVSSLPETALRGRVVDGDGLGIAEASIEVVGFSGQSKTEKEGYWCYYFGLNQTDATLDVTVRLGNGRSQSVSQFVKSRATVLIPTFRFL